MKHNLTLRSADSFAKSDPQMLVETTPLPKRAIRIDDGSKEKKDVPKKCASFVETPITINIVPYAGELEDEVSDERTENGNEGDIMKNQTTKETTNDTVSTITREILETYLINNTVNEGDCKFHDE